jgi:hypothetical protein
MEQTYLGYVDPQDIFGCEGCPEMQQDKQVAMTDRDAKVGFKLAPRFLLRCSAFYRWGFPGEAESVCIDMISIDNILKLTLPKFHNNYNPCWAPKTNDNDPMPQSREHNQSQLSQVI